MKHRLLCPYCLEQDTVEVKKEQENSTYYSCSACGSTVPREYAENNNAETDVICAVGFRGHGKTLYFSSLFYSLDKLATIWPGFYSFAVDEASLDTIRDNISGLKKGVLPRPSPASFPIPTNARFSNMPSLGNRFFIFYDTGGESYSRAAKLIQYASFVKRSRTIILLVSLEDIQYDGASLHELLSVYVQGLTELGGDPKEQDLLVVYSKGDMMNQKLSGWDKIKRYLAAGSLERLKNLDLEQYVTGMKQVSVQLAKFTKKELKALQFLNFARDRFRGVNFCITSSLGSRPVENRLQVEMNPKCVFDPLIWVSYNGAKRNGGGLKKVKRFFLFWRK